MEYLLCHGSGSILNDDDDQTKGATLDCVGQGENASLYSFCESDAFQSDKTMNDSLMETAKCGGTDLLLEVQQETAVALNSSNSIDEEPRCARKLHSTNASDANIKDGDQEHSLATILSSLPRRKQRKRIPHPCIFSFNLDYEQLNTVNECREFLREKERQEYLETLELLRKQYQAKSKQLTNHRAIQNA